MFCAILQAARNRLSIYFKWIDLDILELQSVFHLMFWSGTSWRHHQPLDAKSLAFRSEVKGIEASLSCFCCNAITISTIGLVCEDAQYVKKNNFFSLKHRALGIKRKDVMSTGAK